MLWQRFKCDVGFLLVLGSRSRMNFHSVISPNAIKNIDVILGLHDTGNLDGTLKSKPIDFKIHEDFSTTTLSNDVAVLILDVSPSEAARLARPIALTEIQYRDGDLGTVSGWGTTDSGGSSSPNILHYVTKPILSLENCRSKSYDPSWLDDTMMCCGESGKDACQNRLIETILMNTSNIGLGDSGGPLVSNRDSRLVGIVSWGYGCGFDGYPGVYADVFHLRDWIVQNSG